MKTRPLDGFSQRLPVGDYERAERLLTAVSDVGCESLRLCLSAGDYYGPGGVEWHEWLFARAARDFELLPCLEYAVGAPSESASTRRQVHDHAEFVDAVLSHHGRHFGHVELGSPPLLGSAGEGDDSWLLAAEVLTATLQATRRDWNVVLGTPAPGAQMPRREDREYYWVDALGTRGLLDEIFAFSLHGLYLPNAWTRAESSVRKLRQVLDRHGARAAVWLTEGGFPAGPRTEARQAAQLAQFLALPAERHYWHCWEDPPERQSESDAASLGLAQEGGEPRLAARLLRQDSDTRQVCLAAAASPRPRSDDAPVVIIGGSGFIGSNLARSFLEEGEPVILLDNLSRPGVERNLAWLHGQYGDRLRPWVTDIREEPALRETLQGARAVIHLAAQVAVTTSLSDPLADFDVNAYGTLRVLEALRGGPRPVPLLFASTNKVYGDLGDIPLAKTESGYLPEDARTRERGIAETRALDFRTPYGCSKGVADQYVLDYARSFGVPAAVLRMSCIYGPRQFGTEDQGWVAHFLLQALRGHPITLYGDGWQVRDVLHVGDAVRAYRAVLASIGELSGQAFNLGGGPQNAVSLRCVLAEIGSLVGRELLVRRGERRKGDQAYFVSDNGRLHRALGWQPAVHWRAGLRDLCCWLETIHPAEEAPITQADSPRRSLMA